MLLSDWSAPFLSFFKFIIDPFKKVLPKLGHSLKYHHWSPQLLSAKETAKMMGNFWKFWFYWKNQENLIFLNQKHRFWGRKVCGEVANLINFPSPYIFCAEKPFWTTNLAHFHRIKRNFSKMSLSPINVMRTLKNSLFACFACNKKNCVAKSMKLLIYYHVLPFKTTFGHHLKYVKLSSCWGTVGQFQETMTCLLISITVFTLAVT